MPLVSSPRPTSPVLILGGGIHGAAVARELAMNGVPVVLVDAHDLATGATSKSSRLIHGGLRYLEYGDVHLVRESLVERRRLLELAPHLVRPLRLFVPTARRWSGLLRSVLGFFKLERTRLGRRLMGRSERRAPRGFWPVRIGLWMYDFFSWGDRLPKSRAGGRGIRAEGQGTEKKLDTANSPAVPRPSALAPQPPHVDPARYRWLCEYSDAQMLYPERCVFALLAEAVSAANARGVPFRVVPHATLEWHGSAVRIVSVAESTPSIDGGIAAGLSDSSPDGVPFDSPGQRPGNDVSPNVPALKGRDSGPSDAGRAPSGLMQEQCPPPPGQCPGLSNRSPLGPTPEGPLRSFDVQPSLIVNVSGAWGDLTLKGIDAGTTPMFAGTKGSHFVTRHPALKALLGEHGVYAETGDRRLAFVLPFGDAVLVGTTDERWSGPPELAVASDEELGYLLNVVDSVFGLKLTRADIESHYSGVRPLPRTTDTSNAAVSRDHSLAEHRLHGVPVVTLVGGKLTTFRSVAEQITNRVLKELGQPRVASTEHRVLFGGEDYPHDPADWLNLWQQWAAEFGTTVDEVAALWPLYGMRTKQILAEVSSEPSRPVADSPFTRRTVAWVIDHEWVTSLEDLIERRLMLVFAPRLSLATLRDLAECLVDAGRLFPDDVPTAVEATRARLHHHYGRVVST